MPGADETPPLHPTQLYEAAGELAIFGVLLLLRGAGASRPRRRGHRRNASARKPGTLILLYAVLYGLLRFGVELYRGDFARLYLLHFATPRLAHWLGLPAGEAVLLSTGQAVSVVVVAAAGGADSPAPPHSGPLSRLHERVSERADLASRVARRLGS